MAEIKIERKKGIPVWVILLALIVLALIVWAYVSNRNRNRRTVPDNVAVLELNAPAPAHVFVPVRRCA
ncbi:MAG TPA: hypothetical protein VGH73_00135 [Thermoanaerobaculia bacterium]|jgi:hypothetical protein